MSTEILPREIEYLKVKFVPMSFVLLATFNSQRSGSHMSND